VPIAVVLVVSTTPATGGDAAMSRVLALTTKMPFGAVVGVTKIMSLTLSLLAARLKKAAVSQAAVASPADA